MGILALATFALATLALATLALAAFAAAIFVAAVFVTSIFMAAVFMPAILLRQCGRSERKDGHEPTKGQSKNPCSKKEARRSCPSLFLVHFDPPISRACKPLQV
jgi:hypothetical protein